VVTALALGCVHAAPKTIETVRVPQTVPRLLLGHLNEMPESERPASLAQLPRPIVISVRRFDRVPVDITVNSSILFLVRRGELEVKALDDFYVLLREEGGPLVSRDGVTFTTPASQRLDLALDVGRASQPELRVMLGFDAPGPGSTADVRGPVPPPPAEAPPAAPPPPPVEVPLQPVVPLAPPSDPASAVAPQK